MRAHVNSVSVGTAMQGFVVIQALPDNGMPIGQRAAMPSKQSGVTFACTSSDFLDAVDEALFLVGCSLGETELHPIIHSRDPFLGACNACRAIRGRRCPRKFVEHIS